MGTLYSFFGYNGRTDDPDPVTGLTSREKYLITSTWQLVRKDTKTHGVKLLLIFFDKHPEYISHFPFKDLPVSEFAENKKFQAHGTNIMYALSAIVDNLDNNDLLVGLLVKNGESHAQRSIPEKAYWDLKPALMETLEKGLGSKLTKEGKAAWDKTLDVAIKVIITGLKKE